MAMLKKRQLRLFAYDEKDRKSRLQDEESVDRARGSDRKNLIKSAQYMKALESAEKKRNQRLGREEEF